MYKKHELLIGFIFSNNIFRHIRIFWKILKKKKKKMKMPELSRSVSPIKKEVKRSKLAWTTTTKTEDNFKIWMEKKFLSS